MKNTALNFLPVYDDRYIKIKIRTYGDKVYTNFRGLNVPVSEEYDSRQGNDTLSWWKPFWEWWNLVFNNGSYKCWNDIGEGIDVAKGSNSKECIICHCWFFSHGFKFQYSICNSYHDLIMLCLSIRDIAIITVKDVG